ncbi:MAG: DEAD/DEAH box helicase family protein [Cardiobacteriaceae bacterium]|nr:DEAD/DEAH box helicase family protein [Cardiobacteriaceae bacterium]
MQKEILKTQNKVPLIYAYADERFSGCLKVGYTEREAAEQRIEEQYIHQPRRTWQIVLQEKAVKNNGEFFKDFEVHKLLQTKGFSRLRDEKGSLTEWFECEVQDVQAALLEIKTGIQNNERKTQNFPMRPEQEYAVNKTADYFADMKRRYPNKTPHFLWNAKMRFGKTFTAYQLCKKMGWKKVLILTFKPAVQNAWEEDLNNHLDFHGWQFIRAKEKNAGEQYQQANKNNPIVAFASFQDFLGKGEKGSLKIKNEWAHAINWDLVIFDEYHFGAWRENAQDLFDMDNEDLSDEEKKFDEDILPITANHYLYLSGTPFRAIATGEFVEEQIFNWTYSDEQKAKKDWIGDNNPYEDLPQMVMLTYRLPENISHIAEMGEFNEFDLNEFFRATKPNDPKQSQFVHKEEVQKWLQFIQNRLPESIVDNLKLKNEKPVVPFSDVRLLSALNHTFWFLPDVASCYAMHNLLRQKNNAFFNDYEIIVCAGQEAGIGVEALKPVQEAIKKHDKTITLSCGKLTTGVTVKEWGGIFMLRNASSPETYFQAAFRVQSPFVLRHSSGEKLIVKEQCFVFDFAPNRALRCISEYSGRLNSENNQNIEQKVAEFIEFLPILAYDGASMKEIDATGVLDFALSGTTATLLARKWESALLVNVDNITLKNLMNNDKAMIALENIEGFRALREEIETVINQSEKVKSAKKNIENQSDKEKKQLSEDEKKEKSLRKKIQEKLIKFATRIPIFMYLSEYREETLQDVITKLEPELFLKVTGISQNDFGLLKQLNVFNEHLMNEAVFQFKRYEDASLEYTGINRYEQIQKIGGFNAYVAKEVMDKNRIFL